MNEGATREGLKLSRVAPSFVLPDLGGGHAGRPDGQTGSKKESFRAKPEKI